MVLMGNMWPKIDLACCKSNIVKRDLNNGVAEQLGGGDRDLLGAFCNRAFCCYLIKRRISLQIFW